MAEFFEPNNLAELVIGLSSSRQHIQALVNGIIPFPSAKTGICLYGPYASGKTAAARALPAIFESAGKLRPTVMAGNQLYSKPEPPRLLRRLIHLRGLSHEQVEQVLTRGP